jgi:hypothetical protein
VGSGLDRLKCGWRRDSFARNAGSYSAHRGLPAPTRGRSLGRRTIGQIAATFGENRCPAHNKDSGQSLATFFPVLLVIARAQQDEVAARVPIREGTEVVF